MTSLLTLVINLDDSTDRMALAGRLLDEAGIAFERLPACDARNIPLDELEGYDEARAIAFYGRPLTGGEVGCFKSHVRAVQRFLQSDAGYALVVEDDMTIPKGAKAVLDALIARLDRDEPGNWEIVNLGRPPGPFRTGLGQVDGHRLYHAAYFPITTTGLLWSRRGAEAFLREAAFATAPIDHFLRHHFCRRGTGFALDPALIAPSGSDSVINSAPARRDGRSRRKTRARGYLWKEFRRQTANYLSSIKHRLRRIR
ncbi:glycosyl transferase, family 25 [Lutimaribacter pacificus]|uniref:Glycosyl transferase, family 25 n=1 Tax=Lutimaribacter pacificus TaxID=391948 RepID=A0A1H0GC68_9RHOB|nr:glycosyltransferase family 25 protein [Lutimaribacter pacificus]SDO04487.1 glycosyl transferase, family 25 [Lutimaribacter pacificus]SHJ86870.1 glycosyl transferase, family 25 [Lutimaribacter pacificus]